MKPYYVYINQSRVALERDAIHAGQVRIREGQHDCENCGRDLAQTARVWHRGGSLRCEVCGAEYKILNQKISEARVLK